MTKIGILPWNELDATARERWDGWRAARPQFASPFFDPRFLDAVHAVRGDVEVAVANGGDAYLAFHRDRLGALIPAGGPLSDWHGWVTPRQSMDARPLLTASGAHAMFFSSAPASDPMVGEGGVRRDSHVIDASAGADAYFAGIAARSAKPLRNLRARERKAIDSHGPIRLELDDRSPAAFNQLLEWKSAQYQRTNQFDVFSAPWTERLIRRLFQTREDGFQGRLSTLWFGERMAAAHFGIQSGGVLHYWFPAYDEGFAPLSPGLLLLIAMVRNSAEAGIAKIDLGGGDYRFKTDFANTAWPMSTAAVCRSTFQGFARSGLLAAGKALAALPASSLGTLPERAVRRAYRIWTFKAAPVPARAGGC
ncbi:MAG: GNAT family N-acetyltransferase [Caulobacteraceae bacterium]